MEKHTDALTKLLNRKALELNVSQMIADAEPVAIALMDVDHFMAINDRLGSEHGDDVLKKLADYLLEFAPGQAYRVSGDEFAVVMPGYTLEQAFLHMESLRAKIQGNRQFGLPEEWEVSITAGVAQFPRDAKDYRALSRAADAALMTAKEMGRNQVALPPSEEMVMKSCYYPSTSLRRLKTLAEGLNKKESALLRDALDDLLKKYDKK